MTRKEKLAMRAELEEYYYNCKLQTPEEVAKLFQVYTELIWDHHQAGLCFDYYCDTTVSHLEGTGTWVGGHDALEVETLPTLSANPRNSVNFKHIFCVGDPENGYHFGQVTAPYGIFPKEGANAHGLGDDSCGKADDYFGLCECYVNKVEGRWVITEEHYVAGQERMRKLQSGARPFAKNILEVYEPEICTCKVEKEED